MTKCFHSRPTQWLRRAILCQRTRHHRKPRANCHQHFAEKHIYAEDLIVGLSDAFIVLSDRSIEELSAKVFTYEYRNGHRHSYTPQPLKKNLTTYRDIGDVLLARIPDRCIRLQLADIVRSPSACIKQVAELSGVTFSKSEVPDALDDISLNSVFRTHFADMVGAS